MKFLSGNSDDENPESLTLETTLPHYHVTFSAYLDMLKLEGGNFETNQDALLDILPPSLEIEEFVRSITRETLVGLKKK